MAAAFSTHFLLQTTGAPASWTPYAAIVLAAAIVLVLEMVIPYDRSWAPDWKEMGNDLAFMILVQAMVPLALSWFFSVTLIRYISALDLSITQWWPHDSPLVVQVAMTLTMAELLRYWLHVAAHKTKLWRLHAVHHSSKKLYWLNVGRFHPTEKGLQYLLDVLPFIILGVSVEVLAVHFVFYAVNGFYKHSNVHARYGILNYVISTADLHRWHHSRAARESNTNYGNNLIVWDLVFGTWFLPGDRRVGELGLMNPNYPMGFLAQMTTPFTPGLDQETGTTDAH